MRRVLGVVLNLVSFVGLIAFAVFSLGAAAGHVREMVAARNFAPGNAGAIFAYDIAAPLLLLLLYFTDHAP